MKLIQSQIVSAAMDRHAVLVKKLDGTAEFGDETQRSGLCVAGHLACSTGTLLPSATTLTGRTKRHATRIIDQAPVTDNGSEEECGADATGCVCTRTQTCYACPRLGDPGSGENIDLEADLG